jgi:serine/threonine protein kinase/Flp pilus assembly protein TadD
VVAYVLGTLAEAAREAVQQHLEGCQACVAVVQGLKSLSDPLVTSPRASDSSERGVRLNQVLEEIADRYRRGERPGMQVFLDNHPDLAGDIRELFSVVAEMEHVNEVCQEEDQPGQAGPLPARQQFGDYRILREVGRGGMGVVYEAEQESLGRHVALKVLPGNALLEPRQVQRFQREARAAARLHHTNIVPVFGVGAQDGLHYYVMQFIRGQGLDQVLDELIRLSPFTPWKTREKRQKWNEVGSPVPTCSAVVQALLTGQFASPLASKPPAAGGKEESSREEDRTPGEDGDHPAAMGKDRRDIARMGSPGFSAAAQRRGQGLGAYWRSVGQIGIQVAEALAYAHAQKILHRDIKPSNLLLDGQGTVWITDFGLAKVLLEQDGLTRTGEIVGTLRYLAPERFQGVADVRSDIHALGLTLYELLTLRPAYTEFDRTLLLREVMQGEPPAPRKLNPSCPRDLETIVLKAIAREPARRYQTATELAEDLKRFLDDRPIRARPVSSAEHAWRWCRRHPWEAVLGSLAVVGLLLALGTWVWLTRERAERAEQAARQLKDRADRRDQASQALLEASRSHAESRGTDPEKLAAAHAAAQRAQALLPPGEDELRGNVEAVLAAILRDERLAQDKIAQDKRDRRMTQDLELLFGAEHEIGEAVLSQQKAEKGFRAAFEAYDLSLDRLDPAVAAQKINRSGIRRELLAGLDAWLMVRWLGRNDRRPGWTAHLVSQAMVSQGLAPISPPLGASLQILPALALMDKDTLDLDRLHDVVRRADPDPWRNRLRAMFLDKDVKGLIQLADEVVEQEQSVATLELMGMTLRAFRATEPAIRILRAAQLRHPSDREISFQLALCCQEANPPRLEEALRYFTAALALRPRPAIYYNLGVVLGDLGEIEEAITCMRKALTERPDWLRGHAFLGELLIRKGAGEEAALSLRKVTGEEAPAGVWYNLGLALMQTNTLAEAEDAFRHALDLDPHLAAAHLNLAQVLQMEGRLDDALASGEKGLKLAAGGLEAQPELERLLGLRMDSIRRWIELDRQLPGPARTPPAARVRLAARDRVDMAALCHIRGMPLIAAQLYQEAIDAGERPGQPISSFRFSAAHAALAAGLGEGSDTAGLGEEERARWRRRSLGWLREQLSWCESIPKNKREDWRTVESFVRQFRSDVHLAPMRQPEELDRLSEGDRQQWQQFWADVEAALKRCQRQKLK